MGAPQPRAQARPSSAATTGSPPPPATSAPGPNDGSLVTFHRPRGSGGTIWQEGLTSFATGGPSGLFSFLVGKTLGAIVGRGNHPPGWGMRDVSVDLKAGTVSISNRASLASKSGDLSKRYMRGQEPLLQEALRTGQVPAGVNAVYRPVAQMIAELNGELRQYQAPTPQGAPMSVIVPPGGFAGFAQQVPAAQRVLATGGRRVAGGKRRGVCKPVPHRIVTLCILLHSASGVARRPGTPRDR